jgi:hypothetical protein
MRKKLQEEWIEFAQTSSLMDDIIFDEGEILGEDHKILQQCLAKQPLDASKRLLENPYNRSFQ